MEEELLKAKEQILQALEDYEISNGTRNLAILDHLQNAITNKEISIRWSNSSTDAPMRERATEMSAGKFTGTIMINSDNFTLPCKVSKEIPKLKQSFNTVKEILSNAINACIATNNTREDNIKLILEDVKRSSDAAIIYDNLQLQLVPATEQTKGVLSVRFNLVVNGTQEPLTFTLPIAELEQNIDSLIETLSNLPKTVTLNNDTDRQDVMLLLGSYLKNPLNSSINVAENSWVKDLATKDREGLITMSVHCQVGAMSRDILLKFKIAKLHYTLDELKETVQQIWSNSEFESPTELSVQAHITEELDKLTSGYQLIVNKVGLQKATYYGTGLLSCNLTITNYDNESAVLDLNKEYSMLVLSNEDAFEMVSNMLNNSYELTNTVTKEQLLSDIYEQTRLPKEQYNVDIIIESIDKATGTRAGDFNCRLIVNNITDQLSLEIPMLRIDKEVTILHLPTLIQRYQKRINLTLYNSVYGIESPSGLGIDEVRLEDFQQYLNDNLGNGRINAIISEDSRINKATEENAGEVVGTIKLADVDSGEVLYSTEFKLIIPCVPPILTRIIDKLKSDLQGLGYQDLEHVQNIVSNACIQKATWKICNLKHDVFLEFDLELTSRYSTIVTHFTITESNIITFKLLEANDMNVVCSSDSPYKTITARTVITSNTNKPIEQQDVVTPIQESDNTINKIGNENQNMYGIGISLTLQYNGITRDIELSKSNYEQLQETISSCGDKTAPEIEYRWTDNLDTVGKLVLTDNGFGELESITVIFETAYAPNTRVSVALSNYDITNISKLLIWDMFTNNYIVSDAGVDYDNDKIIFTASKALKYKLTKNCLKQQVLRDGWNIANGKQLYVENNQVVKDTWKTIAGIPHRFSSDGTPTVGWYSDRSGRYYLQDDGAITIGWLKIYGYYYYFNSEGKLLTGKIIDSKETTHILDEEGKAVTGWFKYDGETYYCINNGTPIIGWQFIDGKHYYFDNSGKRLSDTVVDGYQIDVNGEVLDK